MFKILQIAFNAPFVLSGILVALIAGQIARTHPQMSARIFDLLAALARWLPPFVPVAARGTTSGILKAHALLLRGARWEEVRSHAPESAPASFAIYFATENFAQARITAEDWCDTTWAAVAGRESEMKTFFARYGDAPTPELKKRLQQAVYQAELDSWNANIGNRRPNIRVLRARANARIQPFLDYYDAHLALQIVDWMRSRKSSRRRLSGATRHNGVVTLFGLPAFGVTYGSLRALGIGPTKIASMRQNARLAGAMGYHNG